MFSGTQELPGQSEGLEKWPAPFPLLKGQAVECILKWELDVTPGLSCCVQKDAPHTDSQRGPLSPLPLLQYPTWKMHSPAPSLSPGPLGLAGPQGISSSSRLFFLCFAFLFGTLSETSGRCPWTHCSPAHHLCKGKFVAAGGKFACELSRSWGSRQP